jgi:hypothetical protein
MFQAIGGDCDVLFLLLPCCPLIAFTLMAKSTCTFNADINIYTIAIITDMLGLIAEGQHEPPHVWRRVLRWQA